MLRSHQQISLKSHSTGLAGESDDAIVNIVLAQLANIC